MSIELILAIIFFGLLPLIERMIAAGKRRQGGAPPPATEDYEDGFEDEAELPDYWPRPVEPAPRQQAPRPAPMPAPMPRAETPRPVPMPRMETPRPVAMPGPRMDAPRSVTAARRETPRPVVLASSRPQPSRAPSRVTAHDRRTDDAFRAARGRVARREITAALHSDAGLRRAVLLMTILGPCRALAPYDDARR